jgi:hypothetical protein
MWNKWIIWTAKISALFRRVIILNAEHASSMSLCVTLAMIVKQRGKSVDQYSDWPAKLEHALATANIPKEQFETVEIESATQRT